MITVFELTGEGARLLTDYTFDREPRVGSTLVDEGDRVLEVKAMHSVPTTLGVSHLVLHVSATRSEIQVKGSIAHRAGLASRTDASDEVPAREPGGSKPRPPRSPRFLGEKSGR